MNLRGFMGIEEVQENRWEFRDVNMGLREIERV